MDEKKRLPRASHEKISPAVEKNVYRIIIIDIINGKIQKKTSVQVKSTLHFRVP